MNSASLVEQGVFIDFRQPPDTDEEGFFRFGSGAFWFFSVDFVEHGLQLFFECLVFGALVELAYEVASNFEGVIGEIEGRAAQVLRALVRL